MSPLKQSIAWWCFVPQKLTPDALLRAAADLGYAAVELVDPEYWPLVKKYGLKIASFRGHGGDDAISNGLNRRENRESIRRDLRQQIDLAVQWEIPNLICFSGNRNGLDDATGAEITAETLGAVAPMAESAGVTLVLELLNSKIDHPGYQCDHTAWGVQVVKAVNSPRVKLLYDIYHMQVMEGDIIRTIQANHPYIGHYHTAGNPGRHEIDASQELNYRAIAQAIAATGYTGYLGQEFVPVGDPIEGLKSAFATCSV